MAQKRPFFYYCNTAVSSSKTYDKLLILVANVVFEQYCIPTLIKHATLIHAKQPHFNSVVYQPSYTCVLYTITPTDLPYTYRIQTSTNQNTAFNTADTLTQ